MSYRDVPPVSGPHWSRWPSLSQPLYVAADRPELGELVHSEEHGWTVVWYDVGVAAVVTALAQVQKVADQVEGSGAAKVVFVPWTAADGDAFPAGRHIAITHWGAAKGGREYRQFCVAASAGAVTDFVERHPYTESREPNGP